MAEGRIIVFPEDRNNRSRHYDDIVDAALGKGCDRELTVYFDERDLVRLRRERDRRAAYEG
ncbi:hypothetical protein GGD63_003527 [Bradyrhizobium sp. cir1]|nr:hypothetical protein [Bradyrhizobium sp. cir1]